MYNEESVENADLENLFDKESYTLSKDGSEINNLVVTGSEGDGWLIFSDDQDNNYLYLYCETDEHSNTHFYIALAENETETPDVYTYNEGSYSLTYVEAEPEDPELAWSEDSATVTIGADDNVFPTLTNPNSVTVSYSSNDITKATIDETTGEITLLEAGETTISAIFDGDETYEAQTVTYTLTVEAAEPEPTTSTITVVIQDTLDGQPSGDPTQASDSYEIGTNQVIDLGLVMIDGTYTGPTCSDETFVDWSFDAGNDEDDPETAESEAYNATITITSVPNEDLTFSFEHSLD